MEEERLEALRREEEERVRREEEEKQRVIDEARAKAAFEEMLKVEQEKAALREKKETMTREQREKNEPAFKKRKVLDRIQHVFEKNMADDDLTKKAAKVGSIRGKADELFNGKDENSSAGRRNFQDPSLSGISSVLNKVKDRFEVKDECPVTISHGVAIKKKDIPAAATFAMIELKQQKEASSLQKQISSANTEEWSWKKKDPAQLAVESTIALYGASKEPAKKSDREKKKSEQQEKLMSDIKSLNSRFVKRDAIKEHEEKMKEYANFMAEIQEYLKEPVTSNEEQDFKADIQNYIELAAATANKKKQEKRKKSNEKPKASQDQIWAGSVAEIKQRLKEQIGFSGSNEPVRQSNEPGSQSIAQLRDSLQQKLESGGSGGSYQSKMFDAQGSAEVSKIRDRFEAEACHDGDEVEDTKSSYEWKYKKKSIAELQKFMSGHGHLVPASISRPLVAVEKNLAFVPAKEIIEESELKEEEDRVAEYNDFMEKVDQFLNAPDHSSEEIDFKTEIEKYLDLIEEPANEEEVKERQKVFGTAKISRKPQRLDLASLGFGRVDDTSEQDRDRIVSPQAAAGQKDSKFIREMQQKLVADAFKDSPKDSVVVHSVGTSRLTRDFEKLNRPEEVTLLSAPKIVPKKTPEELAAEASVAGQQFNRGSNDWKWKQKDVTDLYKYIKDNYEVVPAAILEQQKNLLATENSIEEKRAELASGSSQRSVEELKKMEEERNQDLQKFLNDVQQFLGSDDQAAPVRGQALARTAKPKPKMKDEPVSEPKAKLTGNVSSIRSLLENQKADGGDLAEEAQDRPKVGKLKSDFLASKLPEKASSGNRFADPVVTSLDANRIKSKLMNQCLSKDEPKPLFSAPKTKLQNFVPTEDKFSAASEIGGLLRRGRSSSVKRSCSVDRPVPKPVSEPPKNELPRPEPFEFKPRVEPPAPVTYKSPYAECLDEDSRKAAILAKFGVKPRPLQNSSSSSSLSSEEDEQAVARTIREQKQQLKEAYGLNDIKERLLEKKMAKENAAKSLNSLRTVLAQIRNTRSAQSHGSQLDLVGSTSDDAINRSDMDLDLSELKGTCSNTRAVFEKLSREGRDQARAELQPVERSRTFSNVKSLFDDATDSPTQQSPRNSGLYKQVSNRSFSNVKNVFEGGSAGLEAAGTRPSNVFSPANRPGVEKSSSFHKVVGAFESGRKIRPDSDSGDEFSDSDSDDDDDDDNRARSRRRQLSSSNAGSQKSLIQAELDEIRSNARLQSVFRINRSARSSNRPSLSSRFGNSSENLDLDEKTLQQVSTTRSAMKNLFESSAPKVTFGGAAAFGAAPPAKPAKQESSTKNWMFDVINKYFDVIEEDEEESGDDDDDDDDDDEDVEEHGPVFATQVSFYVPPRNHI